MPGQRHPRGVRMRDSSNGRSGFDRVVMAVAATFITVSAGTVAPQSVLAQQAPTSNAADLAIDAAIPRPEPANVPPPTASDFKLDTTASVPDPAKMNDKASDTAAESKPADAPAAKDTATTTPPVTAPATTVTTAPAAEPAKESVKAASTVAPA